MDGYATHLHPLVTAAISVCGDILELGCGDYSTPVLAEIAHARGDRLVVCSSDESWSSKYKGIPDEIITVDWETWVPEGQWGLIFLDSEQLTKDRIKWLPVLSKIGKVIVMHDADAAMKSDEYPKMTEGLNIEIYNKHVPWTITIKC